MTTKTEAKRLAFYLFMNVLGGGDLAGRRYLVARDFEPFFDTGDQVGALPGGLRAAAGLLGVRGLGFLGFGAYHPPGGARL